MSPCARSASAEICWTAAAIATTRRPATRPPRRSARTPNGPARPWPRRPRCASRPRRRRSRPWRSRPGSRRSAPRSAPAASWDSSASLRTSSATTAKPRPCSPARAASMAAFSASRLVCSAMPVIVSTIAADALGTSRQVLDRDGDLAEESATPRIASVACAAARTPSRAPSRGLARRPRRSHGRCRRSRAAAVAASARPHASVSTMRTWRSAPCATSPTAPAISPTARPASSEVDAISCEADATVPALFETWPISEPSCPRISL